MNLRSASIIDPEIEGLYVHFPFVEQIATQEHRHDFYEVFLIADGSIYHHVNGQSIFLTGGHLVFVRPDDAHFYSRNATHNCELINLAFLARTAAALFKYLGLAEHDNPLLKTPLPPTVLLTGAEHNLLAAQMKAWGRVAFGDSARARSSLRALLAQILSTFFLGRVEDFRNDVPRWLVELCYQMQQREHVVEGRSALMRLANRAPEYVGRTFRKYLGITPSQFINTLRLDYAGELLLHTDLPVTTICYEVGFENLSHFYHVFNARWHCAPAQFRRMNRRTLIP